jgi:hypothetical protein
MSEYRVIDPETGKPRLNAERCETCILKPTSPLRRGPGRLSAGRLKEIFSDQSGIVCHSTFPSTAAEGVKPALCRGAADKLPSQMIRIYERLGGFTEVPAPPCEWVNKPREEPVR